MKQLLDACTDKLYKEIVKQLPKAWQATYEKEDTNTKRQLQMTLCEDYKDDHSALRLQQAIISTREHPQTFTQYDTLLTQSIATHNDIWTRRITKPLTNERLRHPLQNYITIMQIYDTQNYATLITDNKKYYYYGGLGMAIPTTVTHLHNYLRQWYGTSPMPPALQKNTPKVLTSYTPRQTDGWSFAMHVIITSLSAIYQGHVLILHYGQRHADQLPRMHLRYVLLGEMTPWIDKLITYLSDPLQNEDPEPYSKNCSAGGTELVEHNLAQKITKRQKRNTTDPEPPP
jgi:hypothetical protein